MKLPDIANARLISQQIAASTCTKAKDLVDYMGAIQSQDYAMSKWAIGLRLPDATQKDIEKALNKGEIIRTHVLRPTWHIVPATDIYWMLSLSAQKIKSLMQTMNKQLELTEKIFTKSNNIIEKCLADGKHADRDMIASSLEKGKIALGKNRLSHLLIRAELEQIICSGKAINNTKTYALLSERVPKKKTFSREASLSMLAKKYFTSRGPATAADFSWWAGITPTEARNALEMIKQGFVSQKIDGETYWCSNDFYSPVKAASSVYLLPAYDEFIISYKNRSAALASVYQKKVLSTNGIFYPVIIVNGQVAGVWKRSFENDAVSIEPAFFNPPNKKISELINREKQAFKKFLGLHTNGA